MDIIDINDVDLTFSILFKVTLEWVDPNVHFNFLKENENENFIDASIWKPKVDFLLVVPNSFQELSKKVLVRRETRPSLSGENDIIRVNETYAGENNTILQESTGPVKRMKFEIK